METVNKHQAALIEEISKHQTLSYQELIIPRCETLSAELGAERPIVISDDVVVLYYELLFRDYINGNSLSDETLILLMSYRPIVYHLESIKRTYKEIEEWNSKLERTIEAVFDSGFKHARVQLLKQTMKLAAESLDMSAITYFHYFIGFEFYRPYIGIKLDKLKRLTDANLIFINITYKLSKHKNYVYTYHQPAITLGKSFMTSADIDAFKPIEKTKTQKYKEMISCYEQTELGKPSEQTELGKPSEQTELGKHLELADRNVIALRYSDDCFTLLSNGSEIKYFDKKEAERFLDGAISSTLNKEQLESHASAMYHKELPRLLSVESKESVQLPDASDIFTKHIKPLLSKFSNMNRNRYRQFIERLKEEEIDINKQEKELLILYLSLYTFIDWNYNEFVSYFWAYFEDLAEDV